MWKLRLRLSNLLKSKSQGNSSEIWFWFYWTLSVFPPRDYTESWKGKWLVSLDGFKITHICVSQQKLVNCLRQSHSISTWYCHLYIRMSITLTWTIELSPWALRGQATTSCLSVSGVFSLGVWRRHHGFREPHMGIRICLPRVLTVSGAPAFLVSGFPACLHHHCHGKPPHHGDSDLWFQAPHTHVFPAEKYGCYRCLLLLSHCPEDASGHPCWEEDHLLPGLHGPDLLLPLSGRWDCLLPLSDGLWSLHSYLPAPPLRHHHEHSSVCGAGGGCLGRGLGPLHCPADYDAPIAFLWTQHPR